jgi:hypothetical protein
MLGTNKVYFWLEEKNTKVGKTSAFTWWELEEELTAFKGNV